MTAQPAALQNLRARPVRLAGPPAPAPPRLLPAVPSAPARDAADVEARLRASLRAARGNPAIRRALVALGRDPARSAALRETLGARHALLRELGRLGAVPAETA